jgi:aspartyl-tRNA(Asn)/glutamyl-tRNA(Gln) amidotransferase subunit C
MSQINADEVRKLARLARIALSDEEIKKYQAEITEILSYIERLQQADLRNVEPTYQVTGLQNVMRDDVEIDYGIDQAALLKNVPAVDKGSIKVKRVL